MVERTLPAAPAVAAEEIGPWSAEPAAGDEPAAGVSHEGDEGTWPESTASRSSDRWAEEQWARDEVAEPVGEANTGEVVAASEGGFADDELADSPEVIHNQDGWAEEAVPLFVSVPVGSIEPNEFQPRRRFVEDELDSLAASIVELGVLQPVLLRHIDVDRYELIAGERRWRAAIRAGLTAVPAIVRPADDQSSLEQAVVENLHREDLNPLEEAAAYRQLIDEFDLTQDAVAQRVGKSRSAVANLIRLFQLPSGVQRSIASGELSAGHARALLAFPDPAFQEALAARAVRESLSVRRVEELVRAASQRSAEPDVEQVRGRAEAERSASVLAVEELLADRLATRVEVTTTGERGRIVVEFADAEDLDRVAELLLGTSSSSGERRSDR
ncbi:MAG: ParB/RepB/Spo0J family partition protein [Acidimicrobiales bacterium]